jgi:hypothetical protein
MNFNKFSILQKLLILGLLIILSGLPWWLTNYEVYTHNPYISIWSVSVIVILGGVIKYLSNHKKREIILVVLGAHQFSFLIKVYIDGFEDRTNHNLLPFEMIIFLFIDAFLLVISTSIGEAIANRSYENNF